MPTGRVEAFSDGVIAIIITIMVLEMKAPHEANLETLRPLLPVFLSYVLSFIYVGIYWTNHHHIYHAAERVTGGILWANLHLLFWLSLIPFVTSWMGESHFGMWPVALYGVVLLMCAVAWEIERFALVRSHCIDSALVRAMRRHVKELLSLILYVVGVVSAFFNTAIACALYALVALMWIIPDRRIEREMAAETAGH